MSKFCIIICSFLIFSSCSFLEPKNNIENKYKQSVKLKKPLKNKSNNNSLFSLKVVEEINDGNFLHIRTLLSSENSWNPEDSIILIRGLSNGSNTAEKKYLIKDFFKDKNLLGKPFSNVKADLTIMNKELTDYQLEVLWGKDAHSFIPYSNSNYNRLRFAETSLKLNEKCEEKEYCSFLTSKLINSSKITINSAKIGLSFVFLKKYQKLDLNINIPKNETIIDLSDLVIKPQEVKNIKIDIEQKIPISKDGRYEPLLRVISYN